MWVCLQSARFTEDSRFAYCAVFCCVWLFRRFAYRMFLIHLCCYTTDSISMLFSVVIHLFLFQVKIDLLKLLEVGIMKGCQEGTFKLGLFWSKTLHAQCTDTGLDSVNSNLDDQTCNVFFLLHKFIESGPVPLNSQEKQWRLMVFCTSFYIHTHIYMLLIPRQQFMFPPGADLQR